jgi:transposase-like protein
MYSKDEIIQEYLKKGCSYFKLQKKYGIGHTTIWRWVRQYQKVHSLQPTGAQQKYYLSQMNKKKRSVSEKEQQLIDKIDSLEKQLKHQELKALVLDTLIDVAEKELNISIRKKPGTQQSAK